ncbi:MAG: hypothetical protein ACRYGR_03405 [Janthinobacterium lividum]
MIKKLLTLILITISFNFSTIHASEMSYFKDEELDHFYPVSDLNHQVEIFPIQHTNNENKDHISLFNYDVNIDQVIRNSRKQKRTREEIISDEEDFVKHYLKKQKTNPDQLRSLEAPGYFINLEGRYPKNFQ